MDHDDPRRPVPGPPEQPEQPEQPGEPAAGPAPGGPGAGERPAPGWAAPGAPTPAAGSPWAAPGHTPGHQPPPYPPPGGDAPHSGAPAGAPGWAAPGGPPPAGGGPSAPGPHAYGAPGHAPAHPGPPAWGRPWAPRPGVVALRPLTLGDLFNGAFGYVRANPRTALGLALIVSAAANVITAIGMGGYLSDYGLLVEESLQDPYAAPSSDFPIAPWTIVTMYGGALFSYVGQIVLTGLLAAVVGMAVLGRHVSMSEAYALVRGRLGAVFGVAGLLFLIGLGWSLLFLGVIVGAVVLGMGVDPVAGVLTGFVGVIAVVAVAVWVFVRTSLAMPVAVLEHVGPGRSLARSWGLTQRSWWRVFGITVLAQILVSMVANLLATPFTLGGTVVALLGGGAAWATVVAAMLSFLGTVLAMTLSSPFVIGVTTLLYIDLRMRREGLDLRLQAAAQSGQHTGPEVYRTDYQPAHDQPAAPGGPYGGAPAPHGGYPSGGYPTGGYPSGGYGGPA
ncbi:glycerophosphoryl diester phosphodiesterase membrane domain-containing protein [Streptomonospora sp. S1-112]|uniref:Glycerophosphoryl diester phosphodiesterase membrane domain-containing protein n=1 Tax=Streptomonospora mangrovi TaxID=2883123 RepID=A0A9X3SID9_9ACTN|nr:glycerophosphoryl diester phosphodiesterase membrane domain-containing protein [Streptomonospora mangrovi]MDA0566159.1 glycerophosphoryl diester phosphodiesterase membrane domain-containing protein [Streptomonospora mangrovi]